MKCFVASVLVSLASLHASGQTSQIAASANQSDETAKLQRIKYFYNQRVFPFKTIPAGARLRALRQLDEMEARENIGVAKLPLLAPIWHVIGPEPLDSAVFGGTNSGRVTALAVDPTNPDIVYLGAADGGVWKTLNGGLNWIPMTDFQASLSIGSLAIAPSDHNVIYVGTGEENFNGDSYSGAGVLRSADGGTSWTLFTGPFLGSYIGGMAVDPTNSNIVLAAVEFGGIYRGIYDPTQNSFTWTNVLNGLAANQVFFDSTGMIAYASLGWFDGDVSNGVYKSVTGGQTWFRIQGSALAHLPDSCVTTCAVFGAVSNCTTTCSVGRIALAVAPSNSSVLYAGIQDASSSTFGTLLGFYQSMDGGRTWFKRVKTPIYCGKSNGDGGSCWYNNIVAVHPTNPFIVFAGGDCCTHLIVSLDGGARWTKVGATMHADTHALAFSSTGDKLYVGNDGGSYSTTNTTSSSIRFTSLNESLATIQFYPGHAIDIHNVKHTLGGTQDNSAEKYSGTLTWSGVTCGDAGFAAIDPSNSSDAYTACAGEPVGVQKSTSGGAANTWSPASTGIVATDRGLFIPPLVNDPSSSGRLYVGTFRIFQTTNGASSWTPISPDLTGGLPGSGISAIAVSPNDSNIVYVGSSDGHVHVTSNAGSGAASIWADRTADLPSRYVTQLVIDPRAPTTVYAALSGFDSGHIFKLTGGYLRRTDTSGNLPPIPPNDFHWVDISGNLPNIPVNDLVADPLFPDTLYAATDIGVFQTTTGGSTWTAQVGNSTGRPRPVGLPRVAVLSLKLHNATRTLRAATHGRSMWDTHLAIADLALTETGPLVAKTGSNVTYTTKVMNNGLDAAEAVTLTDQIPSGTTFVSFSTTMGSCTAPSVGGSGMLSCNLGDLADGGTATVSVTVLITLNGGQILQGATVTNAAPPDPNLANNTATTTTGVF